MMKAINISPSSETKDLLYKDEEGFNTFSFCRTSDVFEEDQITVLRYQTKKQMVRYAYYALYSEKVGRIKSGEFLFT